ncbi:MAG: crosslink repair DNA glycosylase YcaQ family protein [Chloroflexota bacterium]
MIRATQTQAMHFILNKMSLVEKSNQSGQAMVGKVVALPALDQSDAILSLQARVTTTSIPDLATALLASSDVIRRPLMRHWPFFVRVADFLRFQIATKRQRRQHFNSQFLHWQIKREVIEQLGEQILAGMGEQPRTANQIINDVDPGSICELTHTSRGGRVSTISNLSLTLDLLEAEGQVLRVQNGTVSDWRKTSFAYALPEVGYPDLQTQTAVTEAEAQAWLTRAYLAVFGPVAEADISAWAGFGKSETRRAVSTLANETTLTMVDGVPGAMMMLKSQADALKATPEPSEPVVNVLPANDPFVTAYKASRARVLADRRLQRQVFNKADHAKPVMLVNGRIVGVWSWETEDDENRIQGQLFLDLSDGLYNITKTKLEGLGALVGVDDVNLVKAN